MKALYYYAVKYFQEKKEIENKKAKKPILSGNGFVLIG